MLQSVVGQTHPVREVIVVDDNSKDHSADVAESFGLPVRLIPRPRRGGAQVAKNDGLRAATGDTVAFLDADDVWEGNKLSLQLPRFSDSSVGVIYCRARTFETRSAPEARPWPVEIREGNMIREIYFLCFCPQSTVLVRQRAALEEGGVDETLSIAHDLDLRVRLAFHWDFAAVADPVIRYRRHPGQLTRDRAMTVEEQIPVQERLAPQFRFATGMADMDRTLRVLKLLTQETEVLLCVHGARRAARKVAALALPLAVRVSGKEAKYLRRLWRRSFVPGILLRVRRAR
ncbi:MAG: glycosyltransferase family 2 protein [Chloroflexi bacterium]|nr:glycosyltransferase family 2 protein [Chloroflexota bacterium]